ncbi:MAG TPA: hypothetical protein VF441_04640 [Acidimicrobiia bacterium]
MNSTGGRPVVDLRRQPTPWKVHVAVVRAHLVLVVGLLRGIGTKVGRVGGTIGDANELGVALVAALALVPPLFTRARARGSWTPAVLICEPISCSSWPDALSSSSRPSVLSTRWRTRPCSSR